MFVYCIFLLEVKIFASQADFVKAARLGAAVPVSVTSDYIAQLRDGLGRGDRRGLADRRNGRPDPRVPQIAPCNCGATGSSTVLALAVPRRKKPATVLTSRHFQATKDKRGWHLTARTATDSLDRSPETGKGPCCRTDWHATGRGDMTDMPTVPDALADLTRLSATLGADPLLIQGAGGNTSLKDRDVMWIKASGTLLADAMRRSIFVPCDLALMRQSLARDDGKADRAEQFLLQAGDLRPSIETSLHAVFSQPVVVHVHCVNTIAWAIRADAIALLRDRLAGFDWAFVPYAKPGAQLARAVGAALGPATDVIVLGNHGLIVAAGSVAAAEALLARVVLALSVNPRAAAPDDAALTARAGDGFAPLPADHPLHSVAMYPDLLRAAERGSLYPDHVLFCGVGAVVMAAQETPGMAVARHLKAGNPKPPVLLVAGAGALIHADASAGARALSRCLGDVLSRVPPGVTLTYLTHAQNAELLDWDAEKYRLALDAGR
jgi:rhamnose utilization protein RhaD (predicted bifunctional aldolase and dehydrogenase)